VSEAGRVRGGPRRYRCRRLRPAQPRRLGWIDGDRRPPPAVDPAARGHCPAAVPDGPVGPRHRRNGRLVAGPRREARRRASRPPHDLRSWKFDAPLGALTLQDLKSSAEVRVEKAAGVLRLVQQSGLRATQSGPHPTQSGHHATQSGRRLTQGGIHATQTRPHATPHGPHATQSGHRVSETGRAGTSVIRSNGRPGPTNDWRPR
jgi:hypothetical protein